jgi:hypothetical protein
MRWFLFLEFDLFFFFSSMDDLILNDITLILGVDVSIETHMNYDKLLILRKKEKKRKKVTEEPI